MPLSLSCWATRSVLDPSSADPAIAVAPIIFESHTFPKLSPRREPSLSRSSFLSELVGSCLSRYKLPPCPEQRTALKFFYSGSCALTMLTHRSIWLDISRTASRITQAIFPAPNCISCRFHFQNDASALVAKASLSTKESIGFGDTSSCDAVSGMSILSPKGRECSVRKRNIHSSMRCALVPPDRRQARWNISRRAIYLGQLKEFAPEWKVLTR